MRTSTLSRSVMAVASLAIGSATFAAVPATAATTTGITRAEVLAAAASLRADALKEIDPSVPTQTALDALAAKVCGPGVAESFGQPVQTPDSVDGLAVTSFLEPTPGSDLPSGSEPATCIFTAIATLDGATTFTGDADVLSIRNLGTIFGNESSEPDISSKIYALSGNVFVSPALTQDTVGVTGIQAEGLVKSPDSKRVLTSVKISDKKTKAQKKAAKKAYSKRLKAIKKSYVKAKRKAGSNDEKRAVARMKYVTRKASAKAAYRYAVADYKLVNRRTKTAAQRRFSVEAYSLFGA